MFIGVNYNLSLSQEEDPDHTLLTLLKSYEGTDDLPIEVHDPLINDETGVQTPNIMEFEKRHVSSRLNRKKLYVYQFNGFIQKIPFFRHGKKYFRYRLDHDGITILHLCAFEMRMVTLPLHW